MLTAKGIRMREITAYISLGSNLGDPEDNLRGATEELERLPNLTLSRCSRVYWTEPQGRKNQPWFANQVAEMLCPVEVTPESLLQTLLNLETRLGRERRPGTPPDSPRVIDLDLLLFGDVVRSYPDPVLPHPRLQARAFVLVPLLEIAPEIIIPGGLGRGKDILRRLAYRLEGDKIYQ